MNEFYDLDGLKWHGRVLEFVRKRNPKSFKEFAYGFYAVHPGWSDAGLHLVDAWNSIDGVEKVNYDYAREVLFFASENTREARCPIKNKTQEKMMRKEDVTKTGNDSSSDAKYLKLLDEVRRSIQIERAGSYVRLTFEKYIENKAKKSPKTFWMIFPDVVSLWNGDNADNPDRVDEAGAAIAMYRAARMANPCRMFMREEPSEKEKRAVWLRDKRNVVIALLTFLCLALFVKCCSSLTSNTNRYRYESKAGQVFDSKTGKIFDVDTGKVLFEVK